MTDQDLERQLERLFRIEPSAAIGAGIDARVGRAIAAGRGRPPLRRWLLVAFAALALMGAAYGLGLLERAAALMPGWQVAYERAPHLTETASSSGYTLTLERAWLDPNQLVLAFTSQGAAGAMPAVPAGAEVIDAAGRHYLEFAGGDQSDGSLGAAASVLSFDVPPGVSGSARLHVSIDGLIAITSDVHAINPTGAWAFDVEVPMEPALMVRPNASATAAGVPITLDWVRLSATSIRVHLLLDLGAVRTPDTRIWVATATLRRRLAPPQALDWTPLPTGWTGQPKSEILDLIDTQDGSDQVFQTTAGVDDPTGEWLLRVDRVTGYLGEGGERAEVVGPWEIRFVVP